MLRNWGHTPAGTGPPSFTASRGAVLAAAGLLPQPLRRPSWRSRSRLPSAWPRRAWSHPYQTPVHGVCSHLSSLASALPAQRPAQSLSGPNSSFAKPPPKASFTLASPEPPPPTPTLWVLGPPSSCPLLPLLQCDSVSSWSPWGAILSHSPDRPWQERQTATPSPRLEPLQTIFRQDGSVKPEG